MFTYKTHGTCSKQIQIEMQGDTIRSVRFQGGCVGNLQGLSRLVEGRKADEVIYLLKGIQCRGGDVLSRSAGSRARAHAPAAINRRGNHAKPRRRPLWRLQQQRIFAQPHAAGQPRGWEQAHGAENCAVPCVASGGAGLYLGHGFVSPARPGVDVGDVFCGHVCPVPSAVSPGAASHRLAPAGDARGGD